METWEPPRMQQYQTKTCLGLNSMASENTESRNPDPSYFRCPMEEMRLWRLQQTGSLPWIQREPSCSRAAADPRGKSDIPSSGECSFRSVRYHQMRPGTESFFSCNVLC